MDNGAIKASFVEIIYKFLYNENNNKYITFSTVSKSTLEFYFYHKAL